MLQIAGAIIAQNLSLSLAFGTDVGFDQDTAFATALVMGGLAAVSACISSARLDSATNSLGQFDELYVIAAAVIGGTSLAGGLGTIYGAILGALVMQSLQSGMTLLNFESAYKDMVVGSVLIFAVWVDQVYRRRVS